MNRRNFIAAISALALPLPIPSVPPSAKPRTDAERFYWYKDGFVNALRKELSKPNQHICAVAGIHTMDFIREAIRGTPYGSIIPGWREIVVRDSTIFCPFFHGVYSLPARVRFNSVRFNSVLLWDVSEEDAREFLVRNTRDLAQSYVYSFHYNTKPPRYDGKPNSTRS